MAIYNDCKIVIDLNKLVKARPCGVDLADEHVDNIANDLRRRMTFDTLFTLPPFLNFVYPLQVLR